MKRVNVYIDWFNVYHVLKNKIQHWVPPWEAELKWCNLRSLTESYLQEWEELWDIYFFTADSWIQETRKRGVSYKQALNHHNITIIKWQYSNITKTFMNKMRVLLFKLWITCEWDEKDYIPKVLKYKTYEEKRTDVNIAVKIVEDAFLWKYDTAIIMSWDSDIVPAVESVKKHFPQTHFMTLWITGTKGQLIKDRCDEHQVIWYKKMKAHRLPDTIKISSEKILEIPKEWK